MSYVRVTLKLEVTDEDDNTGLTEGDYDAVQEAVVQMGGYDIEVEKVEG